MKTMLGRKESVESELDGNLPPVLRATLFSAGRLCSGVVLVQK